jgi:hypothetical protein
MNVIRAHAPPTRLDKLRSARRRDDAELIDEVLLGHSDTAVAQRQRLCLGVELDVDVEVRLVRYGK